MDIVSSLFLVTVFVTLTAVGGAPMLAICEMGQFYDSSNELCTPCSQCPLNHIIRKPCTYNADTECGPFYEFEFFNQGGSGNPKPKKEMTEDFNLFKVDPSELPLEDTKKGSTKDSLFNREGPSIHDETKKWKELCFGLIAALVALSMIFAAYVIIAQVQMSRLHTKAKASSVKETDDETVYCYTHLCTGQQSGNKQPTATSSQRNNNQRSRLPPIYRPGQARRVTNNVPVRASPNDYVLQNNNSGSEAQKLASQEQSSCSRLLPVIPEGDHGDNCDHVRVLYTS